MKNIKKTNLERRVKRNTAQVNNVVGCLLTHYTYRPGVCCNEPAFYITKTLIRVFAVITTVKILNIGTCMSEQTE